MSKKDRHKPHSPSGSQPQPQDPKQLLPKLREAEQKFEAMELAPVQEPVPPNENLQSLLERTFQVFRAVEEQQKRLKERLATHQAYEQALAGREKDVEHRAKKLQDQQKQLQADQAELLKSKEELLKLKTQAEGGFLELRETMLADVESFVERLRAEHKELTEAIAKARHDQYTAEQTQREELQSQLDTMRRESEASLAKLAADRRADLESELAATRRQLSVDQAALSAQKAELAADAAVLAEDQKAMQMKVERLAKQKATHTDDQFRLLTEEKQRITGERDGYFRELDALRSLQSAFEGRPGTAVLQELRGLRDRCEHLQRQLQESPTAADRQRLVQLEQERKDWEEARFDLQRKLDEALSAQRRLRPSALALEDAKTEIQALGASRQLLQRQLEELKAEVAKYTEADNQQNPLQAFVDLDTNPELNEAPTGIEPPALGKWGEELRIRLAAGGPKHPPLYYEPRDLRSFVAGMAMSRLILLQGNSGTGKTSLATGAAAAMGGGYEVVSVQAGWRDRQDLLGYYNAFHRRYYQTPFSEALYRAGTPRYRNTPFFIVLDEINLSRVEQFFADFLSALELNEGDRRIRLMASASPNPPRLMPDGLHLAIPKNVWFIGTANHDETTTEFADKTYDRSHVLELPRLEDRRAPSPSPPRRPGSTGVTELEAAFASAQQKHQSTIAKAAEWMGPKSAFAKALEEHASVTLGNRLDKQLRQYLPVVLEMGGTLGEAMDHVLQTRILRKVRDRHSIQREQLEKLQECLVREWAKLDPGQENKPGMPKRCLELLAKEIKAKG